ncbi:MAG: ribbon-helix-helix domain-containing protein, partial [bacterium]
MRVDYYLKRGLRRVSLAFPADVLVEFDRRVAEKPFTSRSAMVTRAVVHFMTCQDADWMELDQPSQP